MDPLTGFVLALMMVVVNITIQVVAWPFRMAKSVALAHPRRTARMILGAIAAGLLAYVMRVPYVVEISFAGGIAGVVIGEIIF